MSRDIMLVRRPRKYVVLEGSIIDTSDIVEYVVWDGSLYRREIIEHLDPMMGKSVIPHWHVVGKILFEYDEMSFTT